MSEVFSGRKGKFVSLNETINGFTSLLEGEGDEYPETAFYMAGSLEESFEEGRRLATESKK
jgi:F0F1-type ATP synthase beta subunit